MADAKIVIAGAAVLDVLACPVDASVFETGSLPAETTAMTTGGDAMNEACVLASLGADVRLVSKLGMDFAGDLILGRCRRLGMDTEYILQTPELPSSINLVLVDQKGERHFVTARRGRCGSFTRKIFRCRHWKRAAFSASPVFLWPRPLTVRPLKSCFPRQNPWA